MTFSSSLAPLSMVRVASITSLRLSASSAVCLRNCWSCLVSCPLLGVISEDEFSFNSSDTSLSSSSLFFSWSTYFPNITTGSSTALIAFAVITLALPTSAVARPRAAVFAALSPADDTPAKKAAPTPAAISSLRLAVCVHCCHEPRLTKHVILHSIFTLPLQMFFSATVKHCQIKYRIDRHGVNISFEGEVDNLWKR